MRWELVDFSYPTFNTEGTNPLRRYAYSPIGTPALLEYKQLLAKNLTVTATISLNGVEFL